MGNTHTSVGRSPPVPGPPLDGNPSKFLIKDFWGKTHALTFRQQITVSTIFDRFSLQLRLSPRHDFYILLGSRIIHANLTGKGNGLPMEPNLQILLHCRGGTRGGTGSVTAGAKRDRGRGNRMTNYSNGGGNRQMGGGYKSETGVESPKPPTRGARGGRGRGSYLNETRRPTLAHTASPDPATDANRLNAALKATQESHRNKMAQLRLQS